MLVSVHDLTTYMDISLSMRQQDAAELVLNGLQSELEAYLRRPIELETTTETHVLPSYFQGVPATSFFYDESLDTSGKPINYIQPSVVISLRNSPVVSVTSVRIKSLGDSGTYLAEALKREASITAASQSGTNVTFTAANHGFKIGQVAVIAEAIPNVYNTSGKVISSVSSNTFTIGEYAAGLAAYTSGGTATATGNDYTVHRYGLELYRGFPNDVVEVTYQGGLDGDAIPTFKLMILRAATREMQNMHDDVVGVKDLNPRNVAPLETGFTEKELMSLRRWRRRRI